MKQPQYSPLTNAEIVCVIFAGTNGFLDNIPVGDVGKWEDGLIKFMRNQKSDVLDWLTNDDPKIKGDAADKLKAAITEYANTYA